MITQSNFREGCLTIAISGHIDSSKVQLLQDQLTSAISAHCDEQITQIVLDAEDMTFISSLGLRSILQLRKDCEDLSVTNCCPDVFNVFKMTGFTRIINVTKALPRITTDELQLIPGTDGIYHLSEETMVKVFRKETQLEEIERIVQQSREAFIWGVPTVMTFDIVRVGECYGVVFENVERKDITPHDLAHLLRKLHRHIIEPDVPIPSAIERERQGIRAKYEQQGEEQTSKMLQALNTIPEGSALLHGNLSLRAIAFTQRGTKAVIADISSCCYGNPLLDILHLYRSLTDAERADFFDAFLREYYDGESESAINDIRQNILTLHKAYTCYEQGIADSWDEIFSDLHFKMDFAERIRELERQRFYLDGNVNIDWVASALGTNRHYVSDYFNKVLHLSFNEYINNLRLDHAASLIRSGRIPQSQISYSAGFNNDHTFRRLFKQKFGCTPSQFV